MYSNAPIEPIEIDQKSPHASGISRLTASEHLLHDEEKVFSDDGFNAGNVCR